MVPRFLLGSLSFYAVKTVRWGRRVHWPERLKLGLLCVGCAGYLGAVWTLFEQALGGHPLYRG